MTATPITNFEEVTQEELMELSNTGHRLCMRLLNMDFNMHYSDREQGT